jgi:osmotically-inducible protein OsmY
MKTDLDIQRDVIDELKLVPFLNSAEIGVTVTNGIVTLSGVVDTYSKKTAAEMAVKKVAGVNVVAEDIEVKVSISNQKNDTDIATSISKALKWHNAFIEGNIKIMVDSGNVTLDGEVDWEFQRDSARLMIEDLVGVNSINNKIKVKPKSKPNSEDIKKNIIAAFHKSASVNAENISVEIIGTKAILRGNVYSFTEKDNAEKTALSVAGIENVDNRLEINIEELIF